MVLHSDLYPVRSKPPSTLQLCASARELLPLSLPGDREELQLKRLCVPSLLLFWVLSNDLKYIMPNFWCLGKLTGAFLSGALCLRRTP